MSFKGGCHLPPSPPRGVVTDRHRDHFPWVLGGVNFPKKLSGVTWHLRQAVGRTRCLRAYAEHTIQNVKLRKSLEPCFDVGLWTQQMYFCEREERACRVCVKETLNF